MALLFNRVKMTVSGTPGTGTITLGVAFSNAFLTFAEAGVANTNVVSYVIEDGTDFEIGIGTYTSAGTTLSRDTVTVSKIGGTAGTTKLTLTSAAVVRIDARKEDLLSISETQTANRIYAGPSSGGAAAPTFRTQVLLDLPATRFKATSISRDTAAASGNVAYTGIGFLPKAILFFANVNGTARSSWGYTTSSAAGDNSCIFDDNGDSAGTYAVAANNCMYIETGGANTQKAALASFDSDGFTLTWTKVGSPTGTITGMLLAFG